MYNHIII